MAVQPMDENSKVSELDARALTRQVVTMIALIVTVVINALASAFPIAGVTPSEVSDKYPNAFAPAGYAFSIWSAIYLGMFAYVIYQALPSHRHERRLVAIAPAFWVSCAANSAWIFLWHYELLTASLVAMGVLLASLAVIYRGLRRGPGAPSKAELWCVHAPFSLYFGWVNVAALANLTIWAVGQDLSPAVEAPNAWAVTTIGVATLVSGLVGWAKRDPVYLAVFIWAFIAMAARHGMPHPVSMAAVGAAVVIALVLGRALYVNGTHQPLRPLQA
jgi:hypothetical protein